MGAHRIMMYTAATSFVFTLFVGSIGVGGQIIGEDLCACSPSTYKFTLNFDLLCPLVNVTETIGAVDQTSCVITAFGDPNVTDLVPISVRSIDILELGQGLRVLVQENVLGTFSNGDSFEYISLSAFPDEITEPDDVPRAIQINIVGMNQFNESLINVYIITFTNDCGAFPLLLEGESAGWTRFTRLDPPMREVCPFFGHTGKPTGVVTSFPTPTSTSDPTPSPSDSNFSAAPIAPFRSSPPTAATTSSTFPTASPTVDTSLVPTKSAQVSTLSPSTIAPSASPWPTTTDASLPITSLPTSTSPVVTGPPITVDMSMPLSTPMMILGVSFESNLLEEELGLVGVPKGHSRKKRTKKWKLSKKSHVSKPTENVHLSTGVKASGNFNNDHKRQNKNSKKKLDV